jgi:hypothetical protein
MAQNYNAGATKRSTVDEKKGKKSDSKKFLGCYCWK